MPKSLLIIHRKLIFKLQCKSKKVTYCNVHDYDYDTVLCKKNYNCSTMLIRSCYIATYFVKLKSIITHTYIRRYINVIINPTATYVASYTCTVCIKIDLCNSWQYSGWIRLRHALYFEFSLKINKCFRWR